MTIYLVGEQNPLSSWSKHGRVFDLYDLPENSSGGRLRRLILGVTKKEYRDESRYVRRNLLDRGERWTKAFAVARARALRAEIVDHWIRGIGRAPGAVLLGAKVSAAFGVPYEPFQVTDVLVRAFLVSSRVLVLPVLVLPHPSGLNRIWNQPDSFTKAREAVRRLEAP